MLDLRGAELTADSLEHRGALGACIAEDTDLDELVRAQVDVDLVQHGSREPVLPDGDHGVQMMRFRAERAPRAGC